MCRSGKTEVKEKKSSNLYPPMKVNLRETCKSQNKNLISPTPKSHERTTVLEQRSHRVLGAVDEGTK